MGRGGTDRGDLAGVVDEAQLQLGHHLVDQITDRFFVVKDGFGEDLFGELCRLTVVIGKRLEAQDSGGDHPAVIARYGARHTQRASVEPEFGLQSLAVGVCGGDVAEQGGQDADIEELVIIRLSDVEKQVGIDDAVRFQRMIQKRSFFPF